MKKNSEKIEDKHKNFEVFEIEKKSIDYHCYLNDWINDAHNYNSLLEILRKATKLDKIFMHINNGGGYFDTAIQIINAIKACKANTTTILECKAHSAASMIFLSGDERIVNEFGIMLCHNFSGGFDGKGNELKSKTEFIIKHSYDYLKNVYKNFLTSKEIDRMLNGEDFWFADKEIKRRLK